MYPKPFTIQFLDNVNFILLDVSRWFQAAELWRLKCFGEKIGEILTFVFAPYFFYGALSDNRHHRVSFWIKSSQCKIVSKCRLTNVKNLLPSAVAEAIIRPIAAHIIHRSLMITLVVHVLHSIEQSGLIYGKNSHYRRFSLFMINETDFDLAWETHLYQHQWQNNSSRKTFYHSRYQISL